MNRPFARILLVVLAVAAVIPLTRLARNTGRQTTNLTLIIPDTKGIRVIDSEGVRHYYPSALSAVRVGTTVGNSTVYGLNIYSGASGTGYLMGYYEDGHWLGVSIASSEEINE